MQDHQSTVASIPLITRSRLHLLKLHTRRSQIPRENPSWGSMRDNMSCKSKSCKSAPSMLWLPETSKCKGGDLTNRQQLDQILRGPLGVCLRWLLCWKIFSKTEMKRASILQSLHNIILQLVVNLVADDYIIKCRMIDNITDLLIIPSCYLGPKPFWQRFHGKKWQGILLSRRKTTFQMGAI